MKKIFTIFILLFAACTTEPVEVHDDNAVLQKLFKDPTIECAELPDSICVWENGRITRLNCYNNSLTGGIPENIGKLTELTQLGLKSNDLKGEIPESMGDLINLTQLSLGNDSLSGNIPESIGKLKKLTLLDLSHNQLSGSIPEAIGELTALHTFLADSNKLKGTILENFCTIYPNLENYDLSGNQFCPPLPSCIDTPDDIGFQNCDTSCGSGNTYLNGYCYSQSGLDVLQGLIDSANSLNMVMDTDTIAGVQSLELGFQEWQSGRLKTLDCYWDTVSCNLSTDFPVNIINLDSLEYLDIQQNNITGGIPETLADLTNLKDLNISDNQLSGYLPESLCIDDTTVWTDFNLKNNLFCPCYPVCISSTYISPQNIDSCIGCDDDFVQLCSFSENVNILSGDSTCFKESNIVFLDTLIMNSYSTEPDSLDMEMDLDSDGIIQQLEIGEQWWSEGGLLQLIANGSGLTGSIPNSLGNLDTLFILDLSNNYLTGPIPESIDSMNSLWKLYLSNNQLSGEIPDNIANLTEITELQLHNNLFSGSFPEIICEDLELNWSDELLPGSSSIFNNQLCPPYPECIKPFVGVQDTLNCSESESQ